jgi:hypothetical protein
MIFANISYRTYETDYLHKESDAEKYFSYDYTNKKKETNTKNQHYETACESPPARQEIYGR